MYLQFNNKNGILNSNHYWENNGIYDDLIHYEARSKPLGVN